SARKQDKPAAPYRPWLARPFRWPAAAVLGFPVPRLVRYLQGFAPLRRQTPSLCAPSKHPGAPRSRLRLQGLSFSVGFQLLVGSRFHSCPPLYLIGLPITRSKTGMRPAWSVERELSRAALRGFTHHASRFPSHAASASKHSRTVWANIGGG